MPQPLRKFDRDACHLTLLGMSGVGKTRLARRLPRDRWFHFSGDYRIGTSYLSEPMSDALKKRLIEVPDLGPLLRADTIYLGVNITFDNLAALSHFLGRPGNPTRGGMGNATFTHRQRLFKTAEISAMRDLPGFIERARDIYNYPCFINDAGGSLCEIMGNPGAPDDVTEVITSASHLVYIECSESAERELQRRAIAEPKPLFFGEAFFVEMVDTFCRDYNVTGGADHMDPDTFYRWVFPRLMAHRRDSYRYLARTYGAMITTDQLAGLESYTEPQDVERKLLDLIEEALVRAGRVQ